MHQRVSYGIQACAETHPVPLSKSYRDKQFERNKIKGMPCYHEYQILDISRDGWTIRVDDCNQSKEASRSKIVASHRKLAKLWPRQQNIINGLYVFTILGAAYQNRSEVGLMAGWEGKECSATQDWVYNAARAILQPGRTVINNTAKADT